jgi:L-aspartate oxidase
MALQTNAMEVDFLVIGRGIAGLRAAIGASDYGKVVILNKGLTQTSTSEFAQGGVAAALDEEEAAIRSHFEDTCNAGGGLCRDEAVSVLVTEGPRRIRELIDWGAAFDREDAEFAFAQEGAHSHRRILRAGGDATGAEMVKTLVREAAKRPNIRFLDGHFAVDLRIRRQQGVLSCTGAWVLDEQKEALCFFASRALFLATGGVGQLYRRTTNPPLATGDGIAMALRAGASVEDMEFVQFHPTALSLPSAPSFLLSEAMRGEGAILRNIVGTPFLRGDSSTGELSARDVVSRAILDEMKRGHTSHVLLDVTHLDAAFVRRRFPRIYATCLRYGLDITREPIPVAPSAHYLMGGVRTDVSGQTNIARLWAMGEAACTGVHGANRLASNSLLEGLVFGARAVEAAVAQVKTTRPEPMKRLPAPPCFAPARPEAEYHAAQQALKEIMWEQVGMTRSRASLMKAKKSWAGLEGVVRRPALSRLALETRNLFVTAAAIVEAALRRKSSLGAHFRSDGLPSDADPQHFWMRQVASKADRFPTFSKEEK